MIERIKKKPASATAFIFLFILALAVIGLFFYNILQWGNYPDFGYGFRTATGINVAGMVTGNGYKSGLRVGDRFIEINGQTFTNIREFRALMRRDLGDENTYLVERNGSRIQVTIQNVPIGFRSSFFKSGFLFLLGLCYAAIGVLVFLMKPHARSSWAFFLFAATFGLFIAYLYKISTMHPAWLETVHIFIYTFTPAAMIHLALSFPQERNILKRRPWTQFAPYVFSLLLFFYVNSVTANIMDAPRTVLLAVMAYLALSVLFFLASCIQLRIKSSSDIVRLRARMVLLGFAIAASIPLLDFISSAVFRVYLIPNFNVYLPFFIIFPAFVGYSIVKHDLFDIDTIIKRTYGYVLTTGALAGIYGLFVMVSNLAFGGFEFAKSPAFPLIFLLAMVFFFNPIRNRAQRFVDRVFYRLEYDYQQVVERISDSLRTILGLEQIGQSIMDNSVGVMFVDTGSVLLHNKPDDKYEFLIRCGEREVLSGEEKREAGALQASSGGGVEDETCEVSADPSESDRLSGYTLAADNPLIQKIAERKKEVTIYDIEEDPVFEEEREACLETFERLDATLMVPLVYEDRLTGLIALGRKKSGKFYRQEDINLFHVLANQGAIAIENARMVEEVVEKERMEEELNIARDLQKSMLPAECPVVAGFDLAAFSASAREVGGDFYDFIEMGGDRAGMVIGDVTGKSVSGALVMSSSRSVFRMLSEEQRSVAENMMRANRRIKQDVKTGMFVALLYAVLSGTDKSLTLCSAGQTQPVYRSVKTNEAVLLETRGDTFPLGIIAEAEYEETRVQLTSGDFVVLYTDGIVEAMNPENEIFSFERLQDTVKHSHAATSEALLTEIIDQVTAFTAGAPQHDDITVIVIRTL